MPKPSALSATQAKRTLAHRLVGRVDRVRQIATRLGVRPYRVALVWTTFTGEERGEGREVEVKRIELLPTPKVESLDNILFNPMSIGVMPVGLIRLSLVSGSYTSDQLSGNWVPTPHETPPGQYSFYYEIQEDGRGDPDPVPMRYRLAARPMRRAGQVAWNIMLERTGSDHDNDMAPASIIPGTPRTYCGG